MSAILAFGKIEHFGGAYVRARLKVEDVSYLTPAVFELDFYKLVHMWRIMVRNTNNPTDNLTQIEMFNVNPNAGPWEEWNRVYVNQWFDSEKRLDDVLKHILYASEDMSDRIWIRITPQRATTNNYTILFDGMKLPAE